MGLTRDIASMSTKPAPVAAAHFRSSELRFRRRLHTMTWQKKSSTNQARCMELTDRFLAASSCICARQAVSRQFDCLVEGCGIRCCKGTVTNK